MKWRECKQHSATLGKVLASLQQRYVATIRVLRHIIYKALPMNKGAHSPLE